MKLKKKLIITIILIFTICLSFWIYVHSSLERLVNYKIDDNDYTIINEDKNEKLIIVKHNRENNVLVINYSEFSNLYFFDREKVAQLSSYSQTKSAPFSLGIYPINKSKEILWGVVITDQVVSRFEISIKNKSSDKYYNKSLSSHNNSFIFDLKKEIPVFQKSRNSIEWEVTVKAFNHNDEELSAVSTNY